MVYFQDVQTGFENVRHDEREIVQEEEINMGQEAQEEEQEDFIMSKPEGKVTFDLSNLNLIFVAGTC